MGFSLSRVVEDLKSLEELTMQCMKCGICQSVCPLYEKDALEQSVSRGKISLIEAVFDGRLDRTKGVLKYLDYCILCDRCKRFCPSNVKTDEIFVEAKAVLRKVDKLPPYQKVIIKTAVENSKLMRNLQPVVSLGFRFVSSKSENDIRKLKFPIKRNVVSVKPHSFTSRYGGLNKAENEKMRVIFYPGCAISYMYINWGEAIVKTLNYFGVSVYVPDINRCCGIPAATMGEVEIYREMVNRNMDWFDSIEDVEYVITACPTCQWGLSDLGVRVTQRKLNFTMMDILVFLDEILNVKVTPEKKEKTTLHIPCHYDHSKDGRMIKFIKESISSDFEPLTNQNCCGFGGTFSLKHPHDSETVGVSKINEIKEKKYSVLYTPCPGCAMQLTDLAIKSSCSISVRHPIETLYELIKR